MSDRVVIVGGGVIGLCIAHALVAEGADVVVFDAGRFGDGASRGNAGWITPGLSAPLAAPGTMAQALRWMPDPRSPLLVRPTVSPRFLRWSYDFWRACAPARHRAGMAALVPFGQRTLGAFDRLAASGVTFEEHRDGLLFVAHREKVIAHEQELFAEQQAFGYAGQVERLDAAAVHALEPALHDDVAGGLLAHAERHVRPETLTSGLVAHLRASGADLREHVAVRGLARAGRGWRVQTTAGDETAAHVVLATGVACRPMLAALGVRGPVEAAKGYSVTAHGTGRAPRRPLYLLEAKLGVSPFAGEVRLAGTLELGVRSTSLTRRRVEALDRAAARYLADWQPGTARADWAGMRPLTPDGLPIIGTVPGHDGLTVATGHGLLGVTLAPATAELLAPLVLRGERHPELEPFRVERFAGGGAAAVPEPAAERAADPVGV
jgi:D-amino-acid dehydrogenase